MDIHLLPPQVANQIAAGEVVERPAAVVKELMENSLDAGASEILVEVEGGGAHLIRVRDNGCGIPENELGLALKRHATSKIKNIDDLAKLSSMGFRGEALASVAAVSRLTMTSCTEGQKVGSMARVEGLGQIPEIMPAAHPKGTTVEIRDLFFNTPARRRFLRSEKTEFLKIEEIFVRLALSRRDAAMTLKNNGRIVFQLKAAADKDGWIRRLDTLIGHCFTDEMINVNGERDGLKLTGEINPTPIAHPLQYFFVNNRIIKDSLITHAVNAAFESETGSKCSASYVLFLSLDPSLADINVHPQKYEIRFQSSQTVHDFIQIMLIHVLRKETQILPETINETFNPDSDHGYGFTTIKPDQKLLADFQVSALKNDGSSEQNKTMSDEFNAVPRNINNETETGEARNTKSESSSDYYKKIFNTIPHRPSQRVIKKELETLSVVAKSIDHQKEQNNLIDGPDTEDNKICDDVLGNRKEINAISSLNVHIVPVTLSLPWLNCEICKESLFKTVQISDDSWALLTGSGILPIVNLRDLASYLFKQDFIQQAGDRDFLQSTELPVPFLLKGRKPENWFALQVGSLGFSCKICTEGIKVFSVSAAARGISLGNLINSLIKSIGQYDGINELREKFALALFKELCPHCFSIDMADRMVGQIKYAGFFAEKIKNSYFLLDLKKLVTEKNIDG